MKRKAIVNLISALFIFLFVYTGVSKFNDIGQFQIILKQSPLIGNAAILISWMIPSLEILISLALFAPFTRLIGLIASLILMTLFSGYIGYMLLFAVKLPCSCGGVLSELNWSQHLILNLSFVLMAVTGIKLSKSKVPSEVKEEPPPIIYT